MLKIEKNYDYLFVGNNRYSGEYSPFQVRIMLTGPILTKESEIQDCKEDIPQFSWQTYFF